MGKTVVTVLHDLNQASRYCDHLVVLERGQVQAQGLAETVLTPEMLREIFHLEAEIHPEPVSQRPMCVVKLPSYGTEHTIIVSNSEASSLRSD